MYHLGYRGVMIQLKTRLKRGAVVSSIREMSHANRRIPVQKRSQLRLESVLDAATTLLETTDPADISTTMIAAEANVSVGWLYRYLPDKEAVFDTLLVRSLNQLDATLDQRGFTLDTSNWREAAERGIDIIVEFVRNDPCFRRLWYSSELNVTMVTSNRTHDTNLAKQLTEQLRPHLRLPEGQDPFHIAQMFMGIIDKGVDLAFAFGDENGDPAAIEQMKVAATSFLGQYLPER